MDVAKTMKSTLDTMEEIINSLNSTTPTASSASTPSMFSRFLDLTGELGNRSKRLRKEDPTTWSKQSAKIEIANQMVNEKCETYVKHFGKRATKESHDGSEEPISQVVARRSPRYLSELREDGKMTEYLTLWIAMSLQEPFSGRVRGTANRLGFIGKLKGFRFGKDSAQGESSSTTSTETLQPHDSSVSTAVQFLADFDEGTLVDDGSHRQSGDGQSVVE
ncbi:hypothetical protein CI109_104536 [Kwoniella shandongensis]|uniref:Uncharacterized protein n=1 Tax=Kwoniella shandongensis TaxID=1734106 RepID=A0A5M6BYU7_9TREE|nr:uncharacterized protein CI109_005574 [Kwoniella shandongensis]KAA5526139.1 hypothetical protein CI109_005574 [Kwoniella shandongensis]